MIKKYYISANFVKNYLTFISFNVDERLIMSSIEFAQEFKLQNILGTNLFKEVLNNKYSGSTYEDFETLAVNATVYWTVYYLINMLQYRFNVSSIGERTAENLNNVDTGVIAHQQNTFKNFAEQYSERLSKYLCEYSDLFTELSATKKNSDVAINKNSSLGFDLSTTNDRSW
jgi:hypothetical protein